jgi:hypothetical protein
MPVRIAGMVATPVHPVVLLGDVGQRQEVSERSRNGQRRFDRHLTKQTVERFEITVGGTCALGRLAHPLDSLENLVAFVLTKDAPQQLAQQAHVVAQRLMRIPIHPAILRQHFDPLLATD